MFLDFFGKRSKLKTNIILSGDPKQLGAVTKSKLAAQLGYQISYMENLLESDMYNTRNATYITMLIQNYRSHKSILNLYNTFYDGQLVTAAKPGTYPSHGPYDFFPLHYTFFLPFLILVDVNWFISSELLANSQFPVVFHNTVGVTAHSTNDYR